MINAIENPAQKQGYAFISERYIVEITIINTILSLLEIKGDITTNFKIYNVINNPNLTFPTQTHLPTVTLQPPTHPLFGTIQK